MLVKYKQLLTSDLKETIKKRVSSLISDINLSFQIEKEFLYKYEVKYDKFFICYINSKKPLDYVLIELLRKHILNIIFNYHTTRVDNEVIRFTQELTNYLDRDLIYIVSLLYMKMPKLTGFENIDIYFKRRDGKFYNILSQDIKEISLDGFTNFEFYKLDDRYKLTVPIKIKTKIFAVVEFFTKDLDYIIIDKYFKSTISLTTHIFFVLISNLLKSDNDNKEALLVKTNEDVFNYIKEFSKVLTSVFDVSSLLNIVGNIATRFVNSEYSIVVQNNKLFFIKGDIQEQKIEEFIKINKHNWIKHFKENNLRVFIKENVFFNLDLILINVSSDKLNMDNYIILFTKKFNTDFIALLDSFANQLALTINNVQLLKKHQQRTKYIAYLHSAYKSITSKLRYEDAFNSYFLEISKFIKLKRGMILLKDKLRNVFTLKFLFNLDKNSFYKSIAIPYNILENKTLIPLLNNNIVFLSKDSPLYQALDIKEEDKYQAILVPFFFNNDLIGMSFLVLNMQKEELKKELLQLIKNITDYLSNAIDTCNLYNRLNLNLKHNETLVKISSSLSSTLDLKKIYSLIVKETSKLLEDSKSILFLYDKQTKVLIAKFFHLIEDEKFFKDNSDLFKNTLIYKSLKHKKRYYTANIILEIDNPFLANKLKQEKLGACLVIPIRNKNRNIGVILFSKDIGYQFTTDQINLVSTILNQASLNIENAIYYSELEERIRHLSFLFYSAKEINSSLDKNYILPLALNNLFKTFKAQAGAIVYFEKSRSIVQYCNGISIDNEFLSHNDRINDYLMRVYKNNSIILKNSVVHEDEFPDSLKRDGFQTFLIAPLIFENIKECSLDMRNGQLKQRKGAIVLFFSKAKVFSVQELKLIKAITGILSIALRNAQIFEKQLDMAKIIQENVIFVKIPKNKNLDIANLYIPSKDISGDFYDFLISDEYNSLGFVIADVSGKGPRAAIYTVMAKYAIKAGFLIYGDLPNRLLTIANKILISSGIDEDKFITMFSLFIDQENKLIIYSNAGHELPFLYRAETGAIIDLDDANGMVLGVFNYSEYNLAKINYKKGDILVLFTDGITELKDEKGNLFGRQALINIVKNNSSLSARNLVEKIKIAMNSYKRNTPLFDDITLFVIKFL